MTWRAIRNLYVQKQYDSLVSELRARMHALRIEYGTAQVSA